MRPFGWTAQAGVLLVILGFTVAPCAAWADAFLSFPLDVDCNGRPCTPFTARVSAIQDHSVPTGYNCNRRGDCDGVVRAYNGEEGRKNSGENCPPPGYKNVGGTPFMGSVLNYVGAGCPSEYGVEASGSPKQFLNYDGHSGYDFPYGKDANVSIVAPADGTLFQAETDSVNGKNGGATA